MKDRHLLFLVLGFAVILRPSANLVKVEAGGSVIPSDVARLLLAKGGVRNDRELAIPICTKRKKMGKVNERYNAFND
jgi:hypothetical protein